MSVDTAVRLAGLALKNPVLTASGTFTAELTSITAMKPKTNQGIGGRAVEASSARRAAIAPRLRISGASRITRPSFATVPICPA